MLAVPKPTSTGFYERLENSGNVRNQGLEIQISSDNIKTKDFFWNTTFNIGFNKNKVGSFPNNESFTLQYGSTSVYQQVKSGQDIYSWYMPKWLGVDYVNGDPVWEKLIKDKNGNVIGREGTNDYAQADLQVVGKATPKFSGGFSNTVQYKGISLLITGNFVYGNDVYNYTREKYDSDGAYLGYNLMKLKSGWNRWQEPGDVATHPKLAMNGNKNSNKTSSRYIEKVISLVNEMLGSATPESKLEPSSSYPNYFINALNSVETLWAVAHTANETRGSSSIGSMYLTDNGQGWGEIYASDPLLDHNPNDIRLQFIRPKYISETDYMIRWVVPSDEDFYQNELRDKLISDDFLQRIKNNMEALRAGGAKSVLRFAYTSSESDKPWDAPWSITKQHIEQLKPILQEYADVIYVLEAGFVGVWGEWYYTDNYNFSPGKDEYGLRR